MRLRPVLLIILALLTLNVSAAEALRMCAERAAPAEHGHCEKPVAASPDHCCDLMASCKTSLAIGCTESDVSAPRPAAVVAARPTRAPAALEKSPEPPPPKE